MSKIRVSKLAVRKSAKCSGVGQLSKRRLQRWWKDAMPVKFNEAFHRRLESIYGESISVRLRYPFFAMVATKDEKVLLSVFNYGMKSLFADKSCEVGTVFEPVRISLEDWHDAINPQATK